MKAIKVCPMERPFVIDLENELEVLQKEVGGYIQVIYPFEDPVGLVCDDDGKMKGRTANRVLRTEEGNVYDILAGDFLLVGLSDDDFTDLSDDLVEKYLTYYAEPQFFMRTGGRVVMVSGDKIETIV